MGRICRICRRERPHEQFGGRGYAAAVCKRCRKLPSEQQQRILATEEVLGFLEQGNISAKNIQRLESLTTIDNAKFQELRQLVLEIARVRPGKRRRWKVLREQHVDLYERAIAAELIEDERDLDLDDEDLPFSGEESGIDLE